MLASVSKWRIAESLRAGEDVLELGPTSLARHIDVLRGLGLLDILSIRVSDDQLLVVTIYEEKLEGEDAWKAAQLAFREDLEGKLELLGRESGPAYDIPSLLNSL